MRNNESDRTDTSQNSLFPGINLVRKLFHGPISSAMLQLGEESDESCRATCRCLLHSLCTYTLTSLFSFCPPALVPGHIARSDSDTPHDRRSQILSQESSSFTRQRSLGKLARGFIQGLPPPLPPPADSRQVNFVATRRLNTSILKSIEEEHDSDDRLYGNRVRSPARRSGGSEDQEIIGWPDVSVYQ